MAASLFLGFLERLGRHDTDFVVISFDDMRPSLLPVPLPVLVWLFLSDRGKLLYLVTQSSWAAFLYVLRVFTCDRLPRESTKVIPFETVHQPRSLLPVQTDTTPVGSNKFAFGSSLFLGDRLRDRVVQCSAIILPQNLPRRFHTFLLSNHLDDVDICVQE